MKRALLVEYIGSDGVTHSLDMHTPAKRRFIERFDEVILPAPADQLRAAVHRARPAPTRSRRRSSSARKVTGRQTIVAFTDGFHGMTLGALA